MQAMTDIVRRKGVTKNTSARAYGFVLLLVVLVILYGSLYPFAFQARSYPGGPLMYLLSTWRQWDGRGDLLANILLYMPFGFFACKAMPSGLSALPRFLIVLVAGAVLSGGVEAAQFNDAGRVTSMGDLYANAIGTGIGAIVGTLFDKGGRRPLVSELAANPVEALLLAMFFAYRLFPYVPVIDLHKYWHAVRTMLLAPSMPLGELFRYLVTWLFIAALIDVLYGARRFVFLFAFFCGAEFIGKVAVIDNELKLNDIVAAVMAWLVFIVLLRRLPGKFVLFALLFAAMVVIERLQPFYFGAFPHPFGWIPFAGLMHGSIGVNIQAFCQKFYEYGGLIWLLNRGGLSLFGSTMLTAALLFATSFVERWVPGRSAEITDAIMAIVLGGVFALVRERLHRPFEPAETKLV